MQKILRLLFCPPLSAALLVSFFLASNATAQEELSQQKLEFFETNIRPVLVNHCYKCHSTDSGEVKGGLLLDTQTAIRAGGESGHGIVPGNPSDSLVLSALRYEDFEMPPARKLPDEVVADFEKWIQMGAPDPRRQKNPGNETPKTSPTGIVSSDLWSFKPIANPAAPVPGDQSWSNDVDRFVQSKRESVGLAAVAPAQPLTLLRRLYFDLVGLPPPPDVVDQFSRNISPEDFSLLVDQLLASKQFGERWARHWLDVVRYGESAGSSRDVLMLYAWRYRDYVINAFNADMPFDQFVCEQVAGDLLPAESTEESRRLEIATGFLAIGSKSLNGGNLTLDIVDDQIDTIGKSILGMTIGCARCHDHKFDPIPTADYYALAGIFRNTKVFYGGGTKRPKTLKDKLDVYLPHARDQVLDRTELAELLKQLTSLEQKQTTTSKQEKALHKKLPKDWKKRKSQLLAEGANKNGGENEKNLDTDQKSKQLINQIKAYENVASELKQLKIEIEATRERIPELEFALGIRDDSKIRDWPIQIRGDKGAAGPIVPRGFLSHANVPNATLPHNEQSGRLELAGWLVHPHNPLTSRVIVNRIWQHLFGAGLVDSVDNFGASGETPSHPELLDYLARRFVSVHRWSTKSLIRELVATRTYQLSSAHDAKNFLIDPKNRFLWRRSRLRLEAEPLRDAILAASGSLNMAPFAGSLVETIGEGEVGRNIKTDCLEEPFHYRSVYLPVIRGIVPEFLKVFDLPEPSNVQGKRDNTNVPAQALYFMNSPFIGEQAGLMAERIIGEAPQYEDAVALAYKLTLARMPSQQETEQAATFLTQQENTESIDVSSLTAFCQAMYARADFRYLD